MEVIKKRLDTNEGTLKTHSGKLEEHEEKIVNLEKSDIFIKGEFKMMCGKLGSLTKAVWFLGTAIFTTLLYFLCDSFVKGG